MKKRGSIKILPVDVEAIKIRPLSLLTFAERFDGSSLFYADTTKSRKRACGSLAVSGNSRISRIWAIAGVRESDWSRIVKGNDRELVSLREYRKRFLVRFLLSLSDGKHCSEIGIC